MCVCMYVCLCVCIHTLVPRQSMRTRLLLPVFPGPYGPLFAILFYPLTWLHARAPVLPTPHSPTPPLLPARATVPLQQRRRCRGAGQVRSTLIRAPRPPMSPLILESPLSLLFLLPMSLPHTHTHTHTHDAHHAQAPRCGWCNSWQFTLCTACSNCFPVLLLLESSSFTALALNKPSSSFLLRVLLVHCVSLE